MWLGEDKHTLNDGNHTLCEQYPKAISLPSLLILPKDVDCSTGIHSVSGTSSSTGGLPASQLGSLQVPDSGTFFLLFTESLFCETQIRQASQLR